MFYQSVTFLKSGGFDHMIFILIFQKEYREVIVPVNLLAMSNLDVIAMTRTFRSCAIVINMDFRLKQKLSPYTY